jgi:NAD(P)-dependent dehydrogenase (short-subunit alcohol dehydrogenase family)
MDRLTGKVALITGAAGAIGRAIALLLCKEGAAVAITDLNGDAVASLAAQIRNGGGDALGMRHDCAEEADWKQVMQAILGRFGRLDVLVNNAGIGLTKSFLNVSVADWRAVMRVNLDGVFLGCRFGIEAMRDLPTRRRRSPGSIINVSSVLGMVGLSEATAYCASKGGVRLLTKSIALESAAKGWGVRINSIHPAFLWTSLVQGLAEKGAHQTGLTVEKQRTALLEMHPLGRFCSVEDVAAAAVYLASDESSFVTGTEMVIDGGFTAR